MFDFSTYGRNLLSKKRPIAFGLSYITATSMMGGAEAFFGVVAGAGFLAWQFADAAPPDLPPSRKRQSQVSNNTAQIAYAF